MLGGPRPGRARRRRPRALAGAGAIWLQRDIRLDPRPRGFHLIGSEVETALPEIGGLGVGLLHLHIEHTSASLALNENASADVRRDLETWFNATVPEGGGHWRHSSEGPDDMPAHIKAVLIGPTLSLPIRDGGLALGTWQGIYLCEHRDRGGPRRLLATLHGE